MGYTRGSSGKRYRIVPPEGVTGLLSSSQRRIPTFEGLERALGYAEEVFVSTGIDDVRPVVVMLGEKKVGEWTVNGWVAS